MSHACAFILILALSLISFDISQNFILKQSRRQTRNNHNNQPEKSTSLDLDQPLWFNDYINQHQRNLFEDVNDGYDYSDQDRKPFWIKHSLSGKVADRIINGKTASIESHPWTVNIEYELPGGRKWEKCGGTLISSSTIVTAAHCLTTNRVEKGRLLLGTADTHDHQGAVDIPVSRVTMKMHHNRNIDMGVILLDRKDAIEFVTGQIEKLALPERGQTVKVGDNVTVVGWGLQCSNAECTEQKTSDSVLREVELPVVNKTCVRSDVDQYKYIFCAGGEVNGKPYDACEGDSGSPVECTDEEGVTYFCGVVSQGPGSPNCGRYPGTYVQIDQPEVLEFIRGNDRNLKPATGFNIKDEEAPTRIGKVESFTGTTKASRVINTALLSFNFLRVMRDFLR